MKGVSNDNDDICVDLGKSGPIVLMWGTHRGQGGGY